MSAEKCGNAFDVVDLTQFDGYKHPRVISYKALKVLEKMRFKHPNLWIYPKDEAEIWVLARKFGLIEEE